MSVKIAVLIERLNTLCPSLISKRHLVVFFGMQLVGYNIVKTSVITVFHILCVKDLSSRLSFLNAVLCLSTTSTEMYIK